MVLNSRGSQQVLNKARSFACDYGLQAPIILAPMPGATPPELAAAVASGGGMGACGVLLMNGEQISSWVQEMRASSNGSFQLNTWIPDPAPSRDKQHETQIKEFLKNWGPLVPDSDAETPLIDFDEQCAAMLDANPTVVSSIMGLYPAKFVEQLKKKKIKWFAKATTVSEALQAEEAGADVIVGQGMEAGGHKGAFNSSRARTDMVGIFSLIPAICDAVDLPVVASGGVGDARSIAAALLLGASAVEIGTGFLRAPEAGIAQAWSDAIGDAAPEDTIVSEVYSGRSGRSLKTKYAVSANSLSAPNPAPYPIQRNLTKAMRDKAVQKNNLDGMQAWCGQSGRLASEKSASEIVVNLWKETQNLLN